MPQQAIRLTIITEALLVKDIIKTIEAAGASGYTLIPASGKGSRDIRSSGQPSVSDTFTNIKIEVITRAPEVATQIADQVASKYFGHYSGIIYRDEIEVLHAHTL